MKKSNFTLAIFLVLSNLPFFSYSQQSLELASCEIIEYEVNDNSDSDGDGLVCEAKVTLSNSAFYTEDEVCQLSNINWTVIVDLDADGIDDLEYSSSLPSDDTVLDDTNNNGIPDLYIPMTMNNEIQNILLPDIEGPMSNHNVTWTVSDECDFGDVCATSFTVADKKSPTPFCISLASVVYDDYDQEINAEYFNVGVFDNCTDQEDIRISFSADSIVPTRLITCDDAENDYVELKIYFWDESDNIDFCTAFLTVIPGMIDCFGVGEIGGKVKDWRGNPVVGAEVKLNAPAPEFPITVLTDAEGKYTFGVQDNFLNYTLSTSFDDNYLTGASTLDLVLIVRYMLGIQPFLNPYQIIAADINGDNIIKVNDLTLLRKLILGIVSEISTNTSWNFLRSDFEFVNPLNPLPELANSIESPYIYEFSTPSNSGYDFIGIKTGDVNN